MNETTIETTLDIATVIGVDLAIINKPTVITPDYIISHVCRHLDLDIEKVMTKKRDRELVLARQISMYLIRERLSISFKQVGRKFKRDHSTVIHAIEAIDNLCEYNKEFKAEFDKIYLSL